ncbi:MAG: ABC transporter permease [Bacteroidales bacterium]|nr:ABC transporter permease [Candidatus Cacconaster scatequi]
MKFNKIGIIVGHEYVTRVRKKTFLLTTLLTPLLLGLCFCIPALIMLAGGSEHYNVKVIDDSGICAPFFENDDATTYQITSGEDAVALSKALKENGLYAVVRISALDADGNVTVDAFSDEPLNVDVKGNVKHAVNKAVEARKLTAYNINDLDKIMDAVRTDIRINTMTMTESGEAKEDSAELYMILAYLMGFVIYLFVFLFGNSVMQSIIEEKSSRVVEVVVSSVRSVELMMGKIIGVALVALTQFVMWVALTLVIVVAFGSVASQKLAEKQPEAVASIMAAEGNGSIDNIASLVEATSQDGENVGMVKILRQISDLNWLYIIGCFLIYFILGYLLYASMFAAVGAAVDNAADTGQLQMPITIPMLVGLFMMLHVFQHPSSPIAFWGSIIPWTSPMVMLSRIPFGVVPAWELILSIGLLLLAFVATAYLSARIYRRGILSFGKKSTFKDLFKWMKNN